MEKAAKIITLGQFGRPHGVRGWQTVHSFTDPVTNIFNYPDWFIQQNKQWVVVEREEEKAQPRSLLVKLKNCDSPEQARHFTNVLIGVPREQLPELSIDDYYWADLEGLMVINTQGVELGHVDYLFATGANDVIVVKGDKVRLLPYTQEVIQQVNLAEGSILVKWDQDF